MIKNKKGITLIALVVTIIVLLILAGISISMLKGDNGIINQASDSKLETRAGNVKENVDLWKTDNKIRKKDNQTLISKEEMLNDLKTNGLVYENEIDRQNEIIKIGTHEIPYGIQIVINTSKIPETELSSAVLLRVDSVEGIETQKKQLESEEEYIELLLNRIKNMTDDDREKLLLKLAKIESKNVGINIDSLDDFYTELYNASVIESNTKEAFYKLKEERGLENFYFDFWINPIYHIGYNLIGEYNYDTKELLQSYKIENPEGVNSNLYMATTNGEYTFTVEDGNTGKQYEKTINVSNIGENDQLKYKVDNYEGETINLIDKNTNLPTTFSKIYIIYNGNIVDISQLINRKEKYDIVPAWDLKESGYIKSEDRGKEFTFIIEKDNIIYSGSATTGWPV